MNNQPIPAPAQSRDFAEAPYTPQSAAPPATAAPPSAATAAPPTPAAPSSPTTERKAFIFYSNWYDDTLQSLSREEQGEFLLVIVRYAVRGELPGDTCAPILRTMFGLIRPAIDADLQKYADMVLVRKKRAEASAAKRRSKVKKAPPAEMAENQPLQPNEPRINNHESIIMNNESVTTVKEEKEEALARDGDVEEVRTVANRPSEAEVQNYWTEHHMKSDWREFYDYYEKHEWLTTERRPLRSWKSSAVFWEDKFRRDVLPQRRREAEVVARERREQRQAENRRIREAEREAREAEDDQRSAHAVTREQGRYMYDRALHFSNGDDDQAIALLERSSRDPIIFRRLLEGFGQ